MFQKVKEQLAGLHLTQESLKSMCEGVIRAQRKVRWDPGQICREKLINKHLAISYGCLFIKGVSFVFDLTSYMYILG
jgi:hypothetical protein